MIMIKVKLISGISKKEIKKTYTAREFLDLYGEEDLVEDMVNCNCTKLHEYGYEPCDCWDEWDEYTLLIGDESESE